MGGRLGLQALEPLSEHPSVAGRMIFVAPDVPVSTFSDRLNKYRSVGAATLYASENDFALKVSQSEPVNDERRAGIGGTSILVSPFFESVDASELESSLFRALVFGHMNHIHALSIPRAIEDLSMLLTRQLSAKDRGLIEYKKNKLSYWVIPKPTGK